MKRNIAAVLFLALVAFSCTGKKREKEDRVPVSPAVSPQEDARPLIVAFGDSLTAGAGVEPEKNYPALLQRRIDEAGYHYRVVNAGVSGETSAQGLNRTASIAALRPRIVIVEFGANDGLRGVPVVTIRGNLSEMVARLQSAGATVVLAGMQMPPNYGPRYTESFRRIFPDVAGEHGAVLIPFLLDGVGGRAELNLDDGIHPTSEGYEIVAGNVWKVLEPLL